jgi:hypothetical protein
VRTGFRAVARLAVFLFLKIAEPRVVRLIQFVVYVALTAAGWYVLTHPPQSFLFVLGPQLVMVFGSFLTFGGAVGSIAVLPGIWWLERMGVVALWTGLSIFAVIAATLGISYVGFLITIALGGSLGIRWTEIRRYELAPRAR